VLYCLIFRYAPVTGLCFLASQVTFHLLEEFSYITVSDDIVLHYFSDYYNQFLSCKPRTVWLKCVPSFE
jgi:hypothetical protein